MWGRSSSFAQSRTVSFMRISQIASSLIGKLCLTLFAIVFTISITNLIASNNNNNNNNNGAVIKTSSTSSFFNLTDFDAALDDPTVISDTRVCKPDDPIDCRDPDLFHLLMRSAIDAFKDVHFYRFGKPVRGYNDTSCHMAWRYRPKQLQGGETAAFNKDYRSFTVSRSVNCAMSVVAIGEYHSGANARKKKAKGTGKANDGKVFDEMPAVESDESFSRGKYLVYSGGGDRCKSMQHYLWSFTCMLGEALYLNRTLVMDSSVCLSKVYSSSGVDEEGKDFRFYFDLEHLKDSASVLEQTRFWSGWNKWQQKDGLKLHLVEDFRITPMKLADVKDSLIMRKFGSVEPDNYWYRVCEGEVESVIQRPWPMIWKSRRLLDVASAIMARMKWDFDSVHVERGEKARNKELWPNVDRDTSPKNLVSTLKDKIENGRNLYIATDEKDISFFDPLKEKYATHFLDEHKDLWDGNSDWYDEMTRLNNGNAVEFDGYMRICVDSEVFLKGKKQIETFNDLTKDCKDGINRCVSTR